MKRIPWDRCKHLFIEFPVRGVHKYRCRACGIEWDSYPHRRQT